MGMEEKGESAWQQGKEGDTERRVRRKSWGSWQQTGETEMESRRGSQAFSNNFGTLGRRGCPGGTKSLGCSLWVPDLCQARMVWQRGKQLLPSASSPTPPPSRVLL